MRFDLPFERRELEVTPAGKWFLALTIILGTSAVLSGNNLLYLLECALLGGLIVSGIVSEHAIASIELEILRKPAIAEETSKDLLRVKNRSRFLVQHVSLGSWRDGKLTPQAYAVRIPPREELRLRSQEHFERRGVTHWDALAISTRAPFGFARKTRVFGKAGQRTVWPVRSQSSDRPYASQEQGHQSSRRPGEVQIVEGEVRPITPGEDARAIVWILSQKGEPVARRLSPSMDSFRVRLDLRGDFSERELERRIREAAAPFYALRALQPKALQERERSSLEVVTSDGTQRILGGAQALDHLATLQRESRSA